MLYSDGLTSRLRDAIKVNLHSICDSKKEERELVEKLIGDVYIPFNEYSEIIMKAIGHTKSSGQAAEMLQQCEVYWDFMNALTFYCDLGKNKFNSNKLDRGKIIELMDKLCNTYEKDAIVVNAEKKGFKPFVLRLSKSGFKLGLEKTCVLYNAYCLSLSLQDEDGKDKSVSVYLVPELYPKMFIERTYFGGLGQDTGMRNNILNFSNKVSIILSKNDELSNGAEVDRSELKSEDLFLSGKIDVDEDRDVFVQSNFMILPYGVRNNSDVVVDVYDETGTLFEEFLQICFYCLDKYVNRKKVYKKNSEKIDCGVSAKVVMPRERKVEDDKIRDESKLVSLKDIVIYERKHGVRLGGHHASPREHVRRGYWRQYKSGKRVWIKSTTVNKGVKGKTVYEV